MWLHTRNAISTKRELVNLSAADRICLTHEGDLWHVAACFRENIRIFLTEAMPLDQALEIMGSIKNHLTSNENLDLGVGK